MATIRQKRVAKAIVENSIADKPITDIEILKSSNYSVSTSETKSTKIINSEGVQEELKVLGFTEENAMTVVSEIMLNPKAQDNNRINAAKEVFKVQGSYAPEKKVTLDVHIDVEDEEAKEIAKKYELEIKETL